MRYFIAGGIVVLIVGGLVGIKFGQMSMLMKAGKVAEKLGPPPESVSTTTVKEDVWEETLSAVGSVVAAKGVALSSEVPGVVNAIRFESGAQVKAGQVLLELDSSVERAQLASAIARRELATLNTGRSRQLAKQSAIPRSQLDGDEAQLKTSRADLSALQAQIERKTIRAPFSGRLGIRAVNLGQYLNPGTQVTTLESLDVVYVDFTLPQQDVNDVAPRTPVRVSLSGDKKAVFEGTISAVDPAIDATTRSVRLRASIPNRQELLRPGMFVSVSVVKPQKVNVLAAPATAVLHASYGDSVFVVEDRKDPSGQVVQGSDGKPAKVARQQFVRIGAARGDYIAITDGVKQGQELVSMGAFKLRNGVGIAIHNEVQPSFSLQPQPENR
jgi:membrane fusion protein (multidrug efflux system)